jgi:hypothetical protein
MCLETVARNVRVYHGCCWDSDTKKRAARRRSGLSLDAPEELADGAVPARVGIQLRLCG